MHPDWVRRIRDDCAGAGIPFWLEHNGEYIPCSCSLKGVDSGCSLCSGVGMVRVGRKAAGHLLDGVEHRERAEGTET